MKLATEEFDRISKALADPQRREILQKLAISAKLNCSDIHALFDISQPTVSHHLKELFYAGLVEKQKQGQFCYYQVNSMVLSAYATELQRRFGLNIPALSPRTR
jgi:ArsR family transcriptional regulator, arsenate/arsenite/antimonite-responsive transcriptional repressor